ncbi:replication factor C subunit 1-like isoform X2 [Tripterygium wilfordii]|uniref:replication factor C subunit 1-like isoform X2 n=1 Tax=Tripterygium wilfordii TaxID=458696 RepID=UPI0018F8261C|nr:replication factor C subunit 1-like isoform X2 [Tripterygium wilfordii]XP_038714267.1 replication factor C subunit 1-like isoform X2 [Tripterygium wilfordii]XP_038714275.1 replication factor C subunit 1-like isoform X2 [Tripterygium wilfordii]
MGDIRKWFMKSHDKGNGNAPKPVQPAQSDLKNPPPAESLSEPVNGGQVSSGRRKTSKYFAADKTKTEDKIEIEEPSVKRKIKKDSGESPKPPPSKKLHKVEDDDDDFVPDTKKISINVTPSKKLKSGSGRGITPKLVDNDGSDEDNVKDRESPLKTGGRGRGGRGATGTPAGGRGRGGGRGGFMNFGDRKDPPHKGEKEVPEGASDCLAGLTFVISGTLDSLEREEAEDLIKRHGGRVTGSVSKKTNYLLCDEDIGGRKSEKAKELGTAFLTEDGLFDMIRASKSEKSTTALEESKKSAEKSVASLPKKSPKKAEIKSNSLATNVVQKGLSSDTSLAKQKEVKTQCSSLPWTEKYRPKVPNEMIGNQSVVTQLHNWLAHWNEQFLNTGNKGKGKKQNDSGSKKAVLLSGTPGIGKTTSARLVSQMLSFQAIEVNASDSRGKADAKISKGIGGSNANSIKELVSNEALTSNMDSMSKHQKTVLIMDEVDGMSAGDRGGVADLIASIKISKIPIICICNDRYSQKLKSLVNYCLALNFRKPTKQQMAKRLMQVAKGEGLQINEIALEELAERVNGDMRMALNQLQYMSLSMSVIKYDDIRQRLLSSRKDEDISPFAAVDKLLGFNGGKLKMDERIDLSMSDPDLVPLLIQENYINYRPSSVGKDDNGVKRMNLIARAAESIADGDIVNVQIRRYRQWQLSQTGSLASCIFPAALLHGQRETLEQGERNFNRFGGWLGKNSTTGKNLRLLEDFHVHFLSSRESNVERVTLRLEYLTLLLKRMTDPLRALSKDKAVKEVLELMNEYSISQEDFDAIVELSKFHGHTNPLDGIPPAVKSALTRAYNEGSRSRLVKAADLVALPGMRKAPKKRIAAIVEPSVDELGQEKVETLGESEEESSSDTEDSDTANGEKLQSEFQSLSSKGIQVQVELKGADSKPKKRSAGRGKGGAGSSQKTPSGRGKGGSESSEKKGGQSSGAGAKRKR